jgi:glucose-1-phosphate adenylyltransferase
MTDPNLVILAGGISSRMRKASSGSLEPALQRDAEEKSKSLIGVGEGSRPFLDYLLYNAEAAGYRDVVIVVGERDRAMREYYGREDRNNRFHGLSVSYASQTIPEGRTKPLGTADALLQALRQRPDWHGKQLTVCNSDNLYSEKALGLMLRSHAECALIDYDRDALRFESERVRQFAIVCKDQQGRLLDIVEKPSADDFARMGGKEGRVGVSMNIFRFLYERILPFLEMVPLHPVRQEKEIPTAVMMMVHAFPGCMEAIPLAEHVPDLTSREDIAAVRDYLQKEFGNLVWGQRER